MVLSATAPHASASAANPRSAALPDAIGESCPTSLLIDPSEGAGDVDLGWTGFAHDGSGFGGPLTVALACPGTVQPDCGVCALSGPLPNAGVADNQRCAEDSSVACTTDGDCAEPSRCVFFFGASRPVTAGGVPVCLVTELVPMLTGTADLATGDATLALPMILHMYSGISVSEPCPVCTGGVCVGGARAGSACTVDGIRAHFGDVSFDCPPSPSAEVVDQRLSVAFGTGTQTRTLSEASPSCRAAGFIALKCQCDTCDDASATPCRSNADCLVAGGTVCGGTRCRGGFNNGAACTVNTQCPSGVCGVPGRATQPNECSDTVCTVPVPECVGGANDNAVCSVSSECPGGTCVHGSEGSCAAGPFAQFCGPVETFRECVTNADCTRPGDTCSVGRLRDCFDSGNVGDTVMVTGLPEPLVNDTALPTLGALSCWPLTASPAMNVAIGLPGLARLQLPSTLTIPRMTSLPTPTAPTTTATPTPTVTPACGPLPDVGCRRPGKPLRSMVVLKDRLPDTHDVLIWNWRMGAATPKADFGDPAATTNYALCVYDRSAGSPTLKMAADIPGGGTCAGKPCWKESAHGFKYVDKDGTSDGVVSLALKEGRQDLAKITLTAKGVNVEMPTLPLDQDLTVTVQLKNDRGICWDADYSAPAITNDQVQFRDKSD